MGGEFHKYNVRFTTGWDQLLFNTSEQNLNQRSLPCKVSCINCKTLIADEGRRIWLASPSLRRKCCTSGAGKANN